MGITLEKYKGLECPEVRHRRAGDESYDICDLNTKACLIEHGLYRCDYYESPLAECEHEDTTIIDDEKYCCDCGIQIIEED